jgi:hypothetical protein
MSWDLYHSQSEKLAGEAEALRMRGDHRAAADMYQRAAEAEEAALRALDPAQSRTRGITAVSALSLWHKAGRTSDVLRLGEQLRKGRLPHFAEAQVREIMDVAAHSHSSTSQKRFEVEITFRQTLRYSVDAANYKRAEREAMALWRTGQMAVENAGACELVDVRPISTQVESRVDQDTLDAYRYLRNRELVIETLDADEFDPTVHDAVSADEVARHLNWRRPGNAAGQSDTARAARALDRLCAERRVVCFTRSHTRLRETGEIRLYCTPQHLALLSSMIVDEHAEDTALTVQVGTDRWTIFAEPAR